MSLPMPPASDPLAARHELDEGLRFEQRGSLDIALMHYERAACATHDAALLSEAFRRQSDVHRVRCAWELATTAAERAVAVAREARLDDLHSQALSALAAVHRGRGNLEDADVLLQGALRLTHDERVRGSVLQDLGGVAAERDDLEMAQQKFVESYGCFRRAGDRRGEAVALNHYGRALLEAGSASQAARVLAQAIALGRELEDEELVALVTLNVAATLYVDGDLAMAERRASEALGYFNHAQDAGRQIECLRLLGDITVKAQELATAVHCYVRGMQLALRIGARKELTVLAECVTRVRPLLQGR
jgi:tetratricopeptide (TPR) repeat protein